MLNSEASLDWETRSGTDIDFGLPAYIGDPEFSPLCCVFDLDDMMGRLLWTPDMPRPAALFDHVTAGGAIRGWNVMFEWCVWNWHMVPKHDWPELPLDQVVCTMAEAQAMNLPASLDKCGTVLGLGADKLKSKRGKELIKLLCVPHEEPQVRPLSSYRSKGAHTRVVNLHAEWLRQGGRWVNDPVLLGELYSYCDQDVVAERAIKRKVRRLRPWERRVWLKTQEINLRGVPIDAERIAGIHAVVDAETGRLDEELTRLTEDAVTAGSQVQRLLTWVNERLPEDYALRDMTSESVDASLLLAAQPEHATVFPWPVTRALRIRSQVGQTSTAKLPKMLRVMAPDRTLKNMHVYHGAGTGRDASRGGINLQNLKSPTIKDIGTALQTLGLGDHDIARLVWGDALMDAAVSCVRGTIAAPAGWEFTDADFSSVENRVSAWIAGQEDKLELFRAGLDEYKTFAMGIFDLPYEAITDAQRKFSKPGVLGGMFGQGAPGLVEYAAGMGVYLTMEKAQAITDLYRREYWRVKNLWYRCGDAAVEAVRNPSPTLREAKWVKAGARLHLACAMNFLWLRLPSGRVVAWASPKVEDRMAPWGVMVPSVTAEWPNSKTHQWQRSVLIGSSIFQSAVQGTARDLLMHGMFNVEDAGYRVVLRVHDELLSCNPKGFGTPQEYGELMCRAPDWADGLPLAFEAWRGPEFRK